jgi:hypothetical protein
MPMSLESKLRVQREQEERETAAREAAILRINKEKQERLASLDGIARKSLQSCVEFVKRTEFIDLLDTLVRLEKIAPKAGKRHIGESNATISTTFEAAFENKSRDKRSRGIELRYKVDAGGLVLLEPIGAGDLELLRMIDDTHVACSCNIQLRWDQSYEESADARDEGSWSYKQISFDVTTDFFGKPTHLKVGSHGPYEYPKICLEIEDERLGRDAVEKAVAQAYMNIVT